MRIRDRDSSSDVYKLPQTVSITGTKVILASGQTRPTTSTVSTGSSGYVRNRHRAFIMDQVGRKRSDAFADCSMFREDTDPVVEPLSWRDRRYNAAGEDYRGTTYTNGNGWLQTDPSCRLFTWSAGDEIRRGPWCYAVRDRVSLNNAVQAQRNRMNAYNGDLAETFGELPSCPQLFRLINMSKGIRSNLSGLALGIKFGWKPLLESFVAACHELQAFRHAVAPISQRRGIRTLHYKGHDSWDFSKASREIVVHASVPNVSYDERITPMLVSHEGHISYMARVNSRPYYDGALWDLFSRLARVGGIPSLRTLWELAPSSFLVDWFVSVGDVISNIQGNLLYDIDIKEQAWSWFIHDRVENRFNTWHEDFAFATQDITAFYRSSHPPMKTWVFPSVRVPTDLGRISTIGILLAQRLPDRGRSLRSLLRSLNRLGYR